MKQRMKANLKGIKGITLIALVITIIVLIILAGVSINLILGENGIIAKARQASIQSKIADIEDIVNQKYLSDYIVEQTEEEKEITIEDVVGYIEEQGYTVESRITGEGEITGIKLNPETVSLKSGGATAEVEVIYETSEGEGVKYYVEVEGKYYEVEYKSEGVKIHREATELSGETEEGTITAEVKEGTSAEVEKVEGRTITVKSTEEGGTTTITVKYNETYEKELKVNVIVPPSADAEEAPETEFSTAYGKIDIIWVNTDNTIREDPLEPILSSKTGESMKKVTWTEQKEGETVTSWTEDTEAKSDWYNYSEQRWANAKTTNEENESYFVWIPRYAYRITYYSKDPVTNTDESTNPPTGYYDGYGMWKADGTLKYKLESDTIETVDGPDGNKYIVHPAFETDLDNGGWDEDLSGFWFAKYEMSGTESTAGAIKSVPDVTPLNWMTIGDMYQTSRNATYGYTGEEETISSGGVDYTHTSYMHSHLVKNSEWGAVAYLTHSKYGRNGEEITRNTVNNKTGAGLNKATYDTANGAKASTTGNIYGVYDMSGGISELAASFDKASSSLTDYGADLVKEAKSTEKNTITDEYDYISTKYATAYTNGTSNYNGDTVYTVGKTGDATKEVKVDTNYGWFYDYSCVCEASCPFFGRGGYYSNYNAGVFYTSQHTGNTHEYASFRAVLCP